MVVNQPTPPTNLAATMLTRLLPPARKVPPESAKAARAYADYEAMGPDRSYPKLAEKYGRKSGYTRLLERWASDYNWQQRLKDYERTELEARRKERQKEQEAMDKLHATIGRDALVRAIDVIERHIATNDTTLSSAVSLMKAAYELERLARGAATERIEGDVGVTILPKLYINVDPNEEGSEL